MSGSAQSAAARLLSGLRQVVRGLIPRRVLEARARAAELREHSKYSNLPVESVFAEIYRNNDWGGKPGDYYSGVGSHDPKLIEPYVSAVGAFLRSLPERPTLVDLGSGDFNVGRRFVGDVNQYLACDIVPDLQEFNRRRHAYDNVTFLHVNAVSDPLPDGDVVVIRQVLQHLSNEQIRDVLLKLLVYRYWIVTEHLPVTPNFHPNVDISAGCGIRLLRNSGIVLDVFPFNVVGYAQQALCEVESYGGIIRTIIFSREDKDVAA